MERDMLILTLKLTELESSLKTSWLLPKTPLELTELLNSSISLLLNSNQFTLLLKFQLTRKQSTTLKVMLTLTGLMLVQLPLLRTNNNVVHAGPSLPLVLLNLLSSLTKLPTIALISLNNNLLTVQPLTLDATVVLWTELSLTSRTTLLLLMLTILTQLSRDLATNQKLKTNSTP